MKFKLLSWCLHVVVVAHKVWWVYCSWHCLQDTATQLVVPCRCEEAVPIAPVVVDAVDQTDRL